jgi:FKBP-type peptidyl-prolyl cis-trans isomerase SlpA
MKPIGPGSHVTLHYRLAVFDAGEERELISTFDAQPATLQIGGGQLAPTIEQRLLGMAEGERAEFDLTPAEAYGERRAELVRTLTRAAFDANAEPDTEYEAGDVVAFRMPDGASFAGVLKACDAERVVVDFNHPLAGLPLRFSVQVIGVI